jgi:Succinylglutamate desuccinylase / Aspartoacylase family
VTTGPYHRFDGYEELKPLLDGSDEEVLVGLGGKPALVRIPAASTAHSPRARLVSCLLHGNEPSGFVAMVDVLRRGERFPFDLWVLIGNVRAATEDGLYAHRHLDDQEDFNRVWEVRSATTDMRRCAAAILDQLRSADLEAAVDLHNNSGRNPYYSILPELSPEGLLLASLCADITLLWRLHAHTLMEALAPVCPAVSVECGAPHLSDGNSFASGVVHRFLTAGDLVTAVDDRRRPRQMVEIRHRVTVRPEVEFSFGASVDDEAGFVVVPELDRYNFAVLPAQHTIGRVDPGAAMPLFACDVTGRDVTDQLFSITPDGAVIVAADVMPMMMTTTVQQARRDCLFYTASPVDIGKR